MFEKPARFDFCTGISDATLFPYQSWRRPLARGVQAGAEQVVVTNGTQQAVDLVARVLLA